MSTELKLAHLRKARAAVQAAQSAIDRDDAAVERIQAEIKALEFKITALRTVQSAKHLHEDLAIAMRELAKAEEQAVEALAINLAGEIVKRQATDPVRHYQWIVANVAKLRASVRSEVDTPNNERFRIHPLIQQALLLQPKPDDLNTPINQLVGSLDASWPTRRRQILAEAEITPPQAA